MSVNFPTSDTIFMKGGLRLDNRKSIGPPIAHISSIYVLHQLPAIILIIFLLGRLTSHPLRKRKSCRSLSWRGLVGRLPIGSSSRIFQGCRVGHLRSLPGIARSGPHGAHGRLCYVPFRIGIFPLQIRTESSARWRQGRTDLQCGRRNQLQCGSGKAVERASES